MRRLAPAVVTLLAVACTATVAPTTDDVEEPTTSLPPTPTSTVPPVVDCPGAGEFEEGGGIAEIDGEGSDSTSLGRISWRVSDQCESFSFEFETAEGAPATTVPEIAVGHIESFQVIRIEMGLSGSVVADQLVDTELVERLYVVRSLDGASFVDLHLARPAAARVRVASSPARLTVDLRPGFVDFTGETVVDEEVVLVTPTNGSETEPLTTFSGYARAGLSPLSMIVTQGGSVVLRSETIVAEPSIGWGEFRHQLALPEGELSVFVGEQGSDGTDLHGVTVALTVR